jgi:LuxR family transcriptional regulator, maltose regulon positive regulatory protein
MRQDFDSAIPLPLRTELERANLLQMLEDNSGVKLIALFAPSGYGKTTLMAKIARSSIKAVIWLNLHEQISTAELCRDLGAAISRQRPSCSLERFERLRETQTASARALAQDLNHSDDNFLFCLDRVDVLEADTCRWLEAFVATLGEGHQVILGGYGSIPLKLSQFVAQGSALVLGRDQLAFDSQEASVYLKARGYTGDLPRALEHLDGWPAGLAFVASGANPILHPADLVIDALDTLPSAIRLTLCELSVLDTWSEDLAMQLEVNLPRGWLQLVRRSGLPISPLGHGVVRPHRLMLEVLQSELRLEPRRAQEVYGRAGDRAARHREPVRAVQFYLQAQRLEDALRVASQAVSDYLARWEPRTVRILLEALPAERLTPTLKSALGQALLDTGETNRGEALLRHVVAAGDADAQTYYGLALIDARRGRHDQQLQWLEQALELNVPTAQRRKLSRLKASALAGLGQLEPALRCVLACISDAESDGDLFENASALDVAEYIYGALGRDLERERAIERAIELFSSLDMPLRVMALRSSLADMCVQSRRFDEAAGHIDAALKVAERDDHPLQIKLLETRGDQRFTHRQLEDAIADYDTALGVAQRFGREVVAARLLLKLSDAHRQLHRSAQADALLQRAALNSAPLESCAALQDLLRFNQGWAHFEAADFVAAQRYFQALRSDKLDPDREARTETFLLECARRTDANSPSMIAGKRAPLPSTPVPVGQVKPSVAGAVQHRPTLDITTMGRFEVRIDGQVVPIPITKSTELLAWLALHGPARREVIVDALWDGSNERRHAEYFRFGIRRLRSSLSEHPGVEFNPIPFEADHYQIAEHFEVNIDARTLEQHFEPEQASCLEQTLLRCAGDFMPQLEAQWAQEWRTRCRDGALRLAMTLAQHFQESAPQRALRLYERFIARDPLNEEVQVAAIELCQAIGDVRNSRRLLRAFELTLRSELGERLPTALQRLDQRVLSSLEGIN